MYEIEGRGSSPTVREGVITQGATVGWLRRSQMFIAPTLYKMDRAHECDPSFT